MVLAVDEKKQTINVAPKATETATEVPAEAVVVEEEVVVAEAPATEAE